MPGGPSLAAAKEGAAMIENGVKPTFIMGATTANQLLFRERLMKVLGEGLHISTDDGSEGFHGFASDLTTKLLNEHKFDHVYACGPELMTLKVFSEAEKHGIMMQASLERLCKCAIGLCGSCAIGPYRVCMDGPVFDSEMLRSIGDEFGRFKMDSSGRKIKLDR